MGGRLLIASDSPKDDNLAERLATTLRHEAQFELGHILCVLR